MGRQTSSRSLLLALLALAASWTLAAPVFAAPRATGAKQLRSQGGIRRVVRRARVGLALAGRKLSRSHLGRATRHGLRHAAASTAKVGHKLGKVGRKLRRSRLGRATRRLWRRAGASALGQFAAGLVIDGPKDSWRAMRAHPKTFIAGLVATGLGAVVGEAFGLPMHTILVGASCLAAGIEDEQIYQDELRGSSSRLTGAQRARILGKAAWLPALVVATAFGGSAVEGQAAVSGSEAATELAAEAAPLTLRGASTAFGAAIVTGGDVPTSAVTAFETWQNDHAAAPTAAP